MNPEDKSNTHSLLDQTTPPQKTVYKRRWFILALYISYAALNAFQWIEYSIIANVIMRFYQISAVEVDWTSIIYVVLYMPLVIPASYIMEKLDLRQIAIIGTTGTLLGTAMKVFSLDPTRMWVTYSAQIILSSMQVFILALPPRIAAVWFGPKEVSLACALGVFGIQLGQAFGFVIPPMVVENHEDVEAIGEDLKLLIFTLAGFAVVVTLAVVVWFKAKPPTPPNDLSGDVNSRFLRSLRKLLVSRSFNFHTVAYGINIAVFVAISTLLNQLMLAHFVNSEQDAGRIGLIMVTLGMAGAIVFGFILDKTHAYKKTTLALYSSSLVSVVAFMYSLQSGSITLVYLTGGTLGLSINAYMPVGLELAIELTYPEPESTTSGILISMTQTLGGIFTLLLGWLFPKVGSFWALASMALFLFVGTVLTALLPNVTKRQSAFESSGNKVES